ncbi:MAG: hydroxyisourate hydrolase [Ignavibacteriales bacterium]|nr:hydroxyisourate hydrolase [Ignavibacteriales bacterium]
MKSPITTHVLDTTRGIPAEGIAVSLQFQSPANDWKKIASGKTNSDGRVHNLLPESHVLQTGIYRLTFETGKYFQSNKVPAFYPYVQIVFEITETNRSYHVPLLLNPYGYSTYRGS